MIYPGAVPSVHTMDFAPPSIQPDRQFIQSAVGYESIHKRSRTLAAPRFAWPDPARLGPAPSEPNANSFAAAVREYIEATKTMK